MINPKILILPDIHGRKFYCNALHEAIDKGADISDPEKILERLDNGLRIYKDDVHNDVLLRILAEIGYGRAGRYLDGSMIWADLDEYVNANSFLWEDEPIKAINLEKS